MIALHENDPRRFFICSWHVGDQDDGIPRWDTDRKLQVPRDMAGWKDTPVTLHCKRSDNMQEQGEILDFYRNGDVAPGGRLMFCVTETDQ